MLKAMIVVPHSHTWFWTQTCIACLKRYPVDAQIVVVDNSPWSPAIHGLTDTSLGEDIIFLDNTKANKFHASALDAVLTEAELWKNANKVRHAMGTDVVDFYRNRKDIAANVPCQHCGATDYHQPSCKSYVTPKIRDFEFLMAFETDVVVLAPDWLDWFTSQIRDCDFAVGHWHHQKFVNPSCTLYRHSVLKDMLQWCRNNPEPDKMRWGEKFVNASPLDRNYPPEMTEEIARMISWLCGPFSEKRGWPAGTQLKETPSTYLLGPGWYEPGQQLHHWAVDAGYTYQVCPTWTWHKREGLPMQTVYGINSGPDKELDFANLHLPRAKTSHMWGGTRALDIIKHPVECAFVRGQTPDWLAREARFWRAAVPKDIQEETLGLIRKYGWHLKGAGTPDVTDRDREAVAFVRQCYKEGGVEW